MTNAEFIQMATIIAKRAVTWAGDSGSLMLARPESSSQPVRPDTVERFKADIADVFRVWETD